MIDADKGVRPDCAGPSLAAIPIHNAGPGRKKQQVKELSQYMPTPALVMTVISRGVLRGLPTA